MDHVSIQTVPVLSIVGMIVTLLISVGTPIILLTLAMKKWKGKVTIGYFFIGGATFFIFAMVLEQILHTVVLRATGDVLKNNIWLYAVYGGLAAGVFEEVGRFLAMKFFMKKSLNKENAIVYGIGHGGIEAILITGMGGISNLIVTVLINAGQLDSMLAPLDEATRTLTLESLSALWTTSSYQFFLGGMERISAIILHISLSYLVYLAVKKGKTTWFPIAIVIHAVVDAGTVLLAKVIPVLLLEILLMAVVFALAYCIYRFLWKNDLTAEPEINTESKVTE